MYKPLQLVAISAGILSLSLSSAVGQLNHRYSFNTDASDSVGGANGVLGGTTSVKVGQLSMPGGPSSTGNLVSLPAGDIAINTYSAITVELWATPYGPGMPGFATLLGFGKVNSFNSDWAGNYLILQTHRGDDVSRFNIAISDGEDAPWTHETGVNGPEINDGAEHYYAGVLTDSSISLYIDGNLISTAANSQPISGLANEFANIGAAYPADDLYAGTVNELRIYGNALSDSAIAANYAAGPDGVITVPEPTTIVLGGFGLLGLLMMRRRS